MIINIEYFIGQVLFSLYSGLASELQAATILNMELFCHSVFASRIQGEPYARRISGLFIFVSNPYVASIELFYLIMCPLLGFQSAS